MAAKEVFMTNDSDQTFRSTFEGCQYFKGSCKILNEK